MESKKIVPARAPARQRSLRKVLLATALGAAIIVPSFAPYGLAQNPPGQNLRANCRFAHKIPSSAEPKC